MNLKLFVKRNDLSLYRISKRSGIPYTTVCDLINGKTDIMKCSVDTIYKLSKVLGVSMETVIDKEEKAEFVEEDTNKPLSKQFFYQSMLKNRKNVILAKDSALEYMNLTDGNFSKITKVYSTIDLPEPFVVHKVKNFKNIEYDVIDGILISTISQSINDLLSDENSDVQVLDQAINNYYYKINKDLNTLNISDSNMQRFNEEVPYAMEYYNN